MHSIIRIIGILFMLIGIFYFLTPAAIKNIVRFFKKDNRIYLIAIVRFALAIIFLLGARRCAITPVIVAFAILFLTSGMLIFTLGTRKLTAVFNWYLDQPVFVLRIMASIPILVGGVIIYSA